MVLMGFSMGKLDQRLIYGLAYIHTDFDTAGTRQINRAFSYGFEDTKC